MTTTISATAGSLHVVRTTGRTASHQPSDVDPEETVAEALQIILEAVSDSAEMMAPELADLNFARLRQYARTVAHLAPLAERMDSALLDGDAF